jgi:hypothetical protein
MEAYQEAEICPLSPQMDMSHESSMARRGESAPHRDARERARDDRGASQIDTSIDNNVWPW